MDIRDISGLWCDDITFCQKDCEWMECPRNKKNIRDKTIPHSYSVEIPMDCPKKADKEISSRIMDDVGNIINEITTRVVETQDEFIFQTISEWWMHETQRVISKQELINALTLNRKLVRCKDCIHRGKSEKCVLAAISEEKDYPLFMLDNRGEWFCADGERSDKA